MTAHPTKQPRVPKLPQGDTLYGFNWGTTKVTRICRDCKGYFIGVETPRQRLDIHVTPSGLIRTGLHKSDPKDNTFSTIRRLASKRRGIKP